MAATPTKGLAIMLATPVLEELERQLLVPRTFREPAPAILLYCSPPEITEDGRDSTITIRTRLLSGESPEALPAEAVAGLAKAGRLCILREHGAWIDPTENTEDDGG